MPTRKLISFDWAMKTDEERRAYAAWQDDLHYQASMVESTWTAGRLKGLEEGGRKREKEIALNLLQSGLLDAAKIAAMTGLMLEEVEGLKADQFGA